MEPLRKPLLIYDGECRFCCRWMERWRLATGDRVDYEPSQTAAARFPDISPEAFAHSVQWIDTDGTHRSGAEAVLLALATANAAGRMLLAAYQRAPFFARATDAAYGVVARHRYSFSVLTRLLWGEDVRPPAYAFSSQWFLRLLALTYLIAFGSFWWQAAGLTGSQGILPAADFFPRASQMLGTDAFWSLPSGLWLGWSDAAINGWCAAGTLVSLLLLTGCAPALCLGFLWVAYLSLTVAGQVFYQFQWDNLLLEAGFLALFLAPWTWRTRQATPPPRLAHFLLLWLLFRLMFASGVVKLASGDPAWQDGSALNFHYFTQPLPTPLAWFAQQAPAWFQNVSVKITFVLELVIPFFLFLPRRPRLFAAASLAGLQVLIALTGNYGFFNLLTFGLCLLAIDDAAWRKLPFRALAAPAALAARTAPRVILIPLAIFLFLVSLVPLFSAFRRPQPWLAPLAAVHETIAPFRTVNGYGLFAVMTRERREILVQGSHDGWEWKTYTFRFKPGDPRRAPPWVAPYMPRLDWQMWFAALGQAGHNPWFFAFLQRLLEGSPAVTALLEENPFPDAPPRFVRALSDTYTFTTPAERSDEGIWWRTEPSSVYCPEISLGMTD